MKSNFEYLTLILLIITSKPVFSQIIRPQEPKEPFPYRTENIFILNEIDGINLAGTLTLPDRGEPFTTVLLINGSGPQDRNSEIMGHKPFLVLADYLTKQGLAVLRLDDRGTGDSEGLYNETDMNGFIRDMQTAMKFLRNHKAIKQEKIGLLGHSMGGTIAARMAADDEKIDFVIFMASPGLPGDELMLLQKATIERKMGITEMAVAIGQTQIKGAYDIIKSTEEKDSTLKTKVAEYFTGIYGPLLPKERVELLSTQFSLPWLVDFIRSKPENDFAKIKCPVLAINGTNDVQIPAEENLIAIENGIKAGGNKNVTIHIMPGLNHLLQQSTTGMINEYESIEQTMAPEVMELVGAWIEKTLKID